MCRQLRGRDRRIRSLRLARPVDEGPSATGRLASGGHVVCVEAWPSSPAVISDVEYVTGPFDGPEARITRALGIRPSSSSMQLCGRCEVRARGGKTGAEVDIATVFADIRGSTRLSQRIGSQAYRDLMDRFYTTATDVLIAREAIIEQLVGDQVSALFVPGLSGADYVDRAVLAGREMQQAFGVGTPEGPWIDVGIGIDAGQAFVGVVGTMGGMTEITVLGDVPNLTGRLASTASAGEVLVTQVAMDLSSQTPPASPMTIEAKGIDEPVAVYSLPAQNQ